MHSVDESVISSQTREGICNCVRYGPGNEEAGSDQNQGQVFTAQTKRRKNQGINKCEDEYGVSKQREALSVKANTCDFKGLRMVAPAKANAVKPRKDSGKDFVYGVLFGSMMTPTTRDMTVRETYTQSTLLSNLVFLEC